MALLGLSRATKRTFLLVFCLWLAYLAVLAEEPRSVFRTPRLSTREFWAARERGEVVRVVSLNCAGGDADTAAEVKGCDPDIVLLQESPVEEEVRLLAEDLYGDDAAVVWGLDASVLARGVVSATPAEGDTHLVAVHLELPSGQRLNVISLRLSPPMFRLDIWSRGYWRDHAANRRRHRREMENVAEMLGALPADAPVVLGGDFNARAGDAITEILHPRLHDAFREGGVGWGNTVLNDYPVLRFDQVWVSEDLRAVHARSHRTEHSDHRMAVCDVVLPEGSDR
jgi:hypothetical protein